jgi:hypothetical protein
LWILLAPYAFILIGAASNQAVLIANNDLFPVRENIARQIDDLSNPEVLAVNQFNQKVNPGSPLLLDLQAHCLMSSKTHLNWLADNFDSNGGGIYSIGDLIIIPGEWMLSFSAYVWLAVVLMKLNERTV